MEKVGQILRRDLGAPRPAREFNKSGLRAVTQILEFTLELPSETL